MGHSQDALSLAGIRSVVRHALRHLYEPSALSANGLVALLGLDQQRNPASRLHDLLMGAIESLKPADDIPSATHAWRIHDILTYRYVQEVSQPEMAEQFAISIRQLRRWEQQAVEAVAYRLADQAQVVISAQGAADSDEIPTAEEPTASDLTQFETATLEGFSDLAEILDDVIQTLQHMATQRRVRLKANVDTPLPLVRLSPVALRQTLFNLLTVAVQQAGEGSLSLRASASEGDCVTLTVGARSRRRPLSPSDLTNLQVSDRLATRSGGSLSYTEQQGLSACLSLPALYQRRVLLIDDNLDAVKLYERYLADTGYALHSESDAERGLNAAIESRPHAILLDVMMPGTDGWEIIGRLRAHPVSADIPVIVCSFLAQQELAIALGADGYLQKPFTRSVLLNTLSSITCR